MKNSLIHASPRRTSWKWRGALLGIALALGGVSLAISRGALERFTLFPRSEALPARNPALEAKRNRSLSKALAKLDAKTIRAYFERYSNPEKTNAASAVPAVYIDAEALAHRHPAWQLAQRLESGAISPSNPQIARILLPLRESNSSPASIAAASISPEFSRSRIEPGEVLGDSGPRETSDARQRAALNRFLSQNAARGAARARDEALLSRSALEDETARASRVAVSELDVPLLPPDVALELLNLRLELLRNLARTPVQRAAARERIRVIEARYAEILKAQNQAQADRLRATTVEAPELARREGLLQIERQRQNSLQSGGAARREVAQETQARLRHDSASNAALRLALPPFRPLKVGEPRSARAAPRQNVGAPQVFETHRAAPASKAPLEVEGALSDPRRKLATELRREARLEGDRWARECAAALGATWSRDPKSPDATARALNLVFPSGIR